ncbi:hypothetical protein RMATCC62417_05804 [Rhizopus microsporus]|nr:hypothetical protein RMATCC62417_05804 [Rhizopus microsporus]
MREKKRQIVVYDPGKTMINRPASWKRSASEELTGSSFKRARRTPEREEYLMNTLEQLEIHASSEIRHCYQTGGNLGELRKSMLSRSRLPRWIVTGAEARINVKAGEIESLLRTKRTHGKTLVQYWKDFVEAELFNVAQRIRKEVESREGTTEEEDISAQEQEQQIRTFDASLLPLLRSDLPSDIQDTFLKTIEEAVVSASDYIASYSVQVYKLVLLLKKSSFFKLDDDEIILQHKIGVSIQDIVPESFCCQSDINHFSPPIDRSCLIDDTLKKNLTAFSIQVICK